MGSVPILNDDGTDKGLGGGGGGSSGPGVGGSGGGGGGSLAGLAGLGGYLTGPGYNANANMAGTLLRRRYLGGGMGGRLGSYFSNGQQPMQQQPGMGQWLGGGAQPLPGGPMPGQMNPFGGAPGSMMNPQMFAGGGVVTQPTHAMLGERGPEAVIPLGGMGGGGSPWGLKPQPSQTGQLFDYHPYLNEYGQYGQQMFDQAAGAANRDYAGIQHQAQTYADLSGLDPSQAAFQRNSAIRQGMGQLQSNLFSAQYGQGQNQLAYLQALQRQKYQADINNYMAEHQYAHERHQLGKQQHGAMLGALGSIAGSVAGAFIPGAGAALAGGARPSGPSPGSVPGSYTGTNSGWYGGGGGSGYSPYDPSQPWAGGR